MGKRCLSCDVLQGYDNRSFHRFPKDRERKIMWMNSLNIKHENLPRCSYVCSHHFDTASFIIKPKGSVWLKSTAVPKILNTSPVLGMPSSQEEFLVNKIKIEEVNISMPTFKSDSPTPFHAQQSFVKLEAPPSKSEDESFNDGASFSPHENVFSNKYISPALSSNSTTLTAQSSSTITASPNGTDENPMGSNGVTKQRRKRKRFNNPRYFGDLNFEEMTDPVKAKKHWFLVQKVISDQRRKITALQAAKRRLKNKLYNVQSLLKYFQDQNMFLANQTTLNVPPDREADIFVEFS